MNWKPIETAPKDEAILTFDRYCGVMMVRWDRQHKDWRVLDPYLARLAGDEFNMTHWMPLPEPPEELEVVK